MIAPVRDELPPARPSVRPLSGLALAFAILGGPIAWMLQHVVSYFLVTLTCTSGWGGLSLGIVISTVAFATIAVAAGTVAYREWQRATARPESGGDQVHRTRFLTMMGWVLAAVFALVIVLTGLPPFFMPPCG